MNRKLLASAMTVGVLSAPVAIAVADETETKTNTDTPAAAKQHRELVEQRLRATRVIKRAEARERKAKAKARAKKRAKKRAKLVAKRQAAAVAQGQKTAPAATSQAGGGGATPGHLQAIAACESGGNPSAVGGGGAYRGKYQFDRSTWASVGGSGDPAAAPEGEQDKRAAMLYARAGSAPWPVCGG